MMSLHFPSIISLMFSIFTCDVIISTFYVNMTLRNFDFSSHDYNLSISTVIIMNF